MPPLALQLAPHDHPPIWRLVAMTALAILLWIYVIWQFRADRREKQNPTQAPPQTHTIKLREIKFPELDHLPEPERERLIRSVLGTPEIKKFEQRTGKLTGMIFYISMAILLLVAVTSDLPKWGITACVVIGSIGTVITTIWIRLRIELKIVRRLLKQNLTSISEASNSQSKTTS